MATRNEKLALRGFDALGNEGVEAMLEFVHPEFEMETLPGIAAEPQVYSGHEGVWHWFESFYEVMDEVEVKPQEIEDLGDDRVRLALTLRATGQTSGIEVEQEAQAIATIRDDLMYRLEFLLPDSA